MWGYAASPLVTNSLVIIYAGGDGDKGVMAFDAANGQPKWTVACGPESYSSPQLSKVLPVRKVARYLQIENKIRAVVKYDIASGVPLVR